MFTLKKITYALLLLNTLPTVQAEAQQTSAISAPGMSLIHQAALIKPVEADKTIHFTVWLKLRNAAQLDQIVKDIYDSTSSRYQKFLTQDEYHQHYAASPEVKNLIQKYFTDQNMQATIVNDRVDVIAKAEQIEKVLHVKMNYYRFKNRTGYSNTAEPELNIEIAPYVKTITGLSTMSDFTPHGRELPDLLAGKKSVKIHDINMEWESFVPAVQPTTTSIGGFTGANIKTTYNLANIPPVNGTAINGAGQTIVITAACGGNSPARIRADANVYNAANGLPALSAANFAVVNSDGTPFTTCRITPPTGWEGEIALDVAAVHTIAPAANIVLVLNRNNNNLGLTVDNVVHQLINNNYTIAGFHNAYVVSNSWGDQEGFGYWPIESTFQLAAANGISFNFSTGECGDGSYSSPACFSLEQGNNVQYPSSSAFVTAVGGTSVFVDSAWKYAFETVWGTFFNGDFYFGSGGGISKFFGPVVWQNPIKFFIAGGYGMVNDFNKRALPDIAMLADPLTGLRIFVSGSWRTIGGTSLANALFSGTLALTNQARLLNNMNQIGLAAPYFYTHNSPLLHTNSLHIIHAPHLIISGATLPPVGAPNSAFSIFDLTYGWDSSLSINPASQFWNDAVGVGTPNIPNFVLTMASF